MRSIPVAFALLACSAAAQTLPSPDSVFAAAVQSLKTAKYADAEVGFRTVAQLEPDRLRGYLGVAQVYMAQKKTNEALGYLRKETDRMPTRPDLRVALGDTAVRAGQYDAALSEFQSALASLETNTAVELDVPRGANAATLQHSAVADPRAESLQVLTVRDYTPKGAAGIHLRMAEVFRLKQDHAASIGEWQKTSALLPKTGWILANLGLEQEVGGKPVDAMKSYRESLALLPDNAVVLNNLAFLLAEQGGDLYEALRYARLADILMPGAPDILDTQGWIALKQGYFDDATGTFMRVVRRQPGRPEFRKHLAAALTRRGVHTPAIDELIERLNSPVIAGDDEKILQLLEKAGK